MKSRERELLDEAIAVLIAALAHDEAIECGAPPNELAELRQFWVPDAEALIIEAERLNLLGDDDDV